MGELIDYYIIESVIEYVDDPLKIGRIRCSIPGVIHHSTTTTKEALPWARPFKMHGYQTFDKPLVGQKVWILLNKSNYNELWWFPFYETIDIVQGYLNDYYDETPDVFHAREGYVTPIMSTWDDKQGYKWVIGEDYIDFFPTREFKMKVNDCNINIKDNIIEVGGDTEGEYEPGIKGEQLCKLLGDLKSSCNNVASAANSIPYLTGHLSVPLQKFAETFTSMNDQIKCKKLHVN